MIDFNTNLKLKTKEVEDYYIIISQKKKANRK